MCVHRFTVVGLIAVAILTVGLAGCATTGRRAEPAKTGAEASAAKAAKPTGTEADKTKKEAEEQEKYEQEQADDARKLAKLQRDLVIARERVVRAKMEVDHTEREQDDAISKADRELALEVQRQAIFTERSAPNRIEWSKLGLARAQDRVAEAHEELNQLELMYAEEDFADQTKEIVLHRSRRRVERSKRDLELRHEDDAILTEKTIPLETAEHGERVTQKTAALQKARREAEAARLDKQIDLMSAEAEVERIEAEINALREKMDKRRERHEAKSSEKE